jgi:hypothetical protein
MRIYQNNTIESIFRLLTLYKTEIKKYDKMFDNDDYQLRYVVNKWILNDKVDIKVLLMVQKRSFWNKIVEDPYKVKKTLENYCKYFSLSETSLVRPYSFHCKKSKENSAIFHKLDIKKRVSFEYY